MSDHRTAMRGRLIAEMQRLHARRRARRSALVACAVMALCALPLLMRPTSSRSTGGSSLIVAEGARPAPPEAPSGITFTRLATDPTAVARLSVDAPPSRVRFVDDPGLAALLAEVGRPAGVVRMGEAIWLTADVTNGTEPADGL
ncbi:MAG: hypothetical protein AAFX05_04330 [Planctomycetota bacterium]